MTEPSASASASDTDTAAPRGPADLFRVFNRLALQGFGGVLPIAHRELVERERWLSPAQFVDLLAAAQVLPGPNIVNVSLMFGDRCFGLRGALAAASGLLAVPLAVVLALAAAYQHAQHLSAIQGALRGMGAVAAGLVIATGLKLMRTLRDNPLGRAWGFGLALVTLAAVGLARLPMLWAVLVLGGGGVALAMGKIRTQQRRQAAAAPQADDGQPRP